MGKEKKASMSIWARFPQELYEAKCVGADDVCEVLEESYGALTVSEFLMLRMVRELEGIEAVLYELRDHKE